LEELPVGAALPEELELDEPEDEGGDPPMAIDLKAE